MKAILGPISVVLLWMLAPASAAVPSAQSPATAGVKSDSHGTDGASASEGSIKAVTYKVRGGPTRIGFKGTTLLPLGEGEASIENKEGIVAISARIERLRPPSVYGSEFLTYVLWAITPEGRAINLGELAMNGHRKVKLDVTTQLQSFALIITAEPYFAVVRPSDVVVMENAIRRDTAGTFQDVDAYFDMDKRAQYAARMANADNVAPPSDLNVSEPVPLDLAQARNAVRIATGAGAGTFAPDTLNRATTLLTQAETEHLAGSPKQSSTFAREAVQTAEDARLVSMRGMAELRYFIERQVLLEREEALKARVLEAFAQIQMEVQEREDKANAKIAMLEADRNRIEQQVDVERMKAESANREAEQAKRAAADNRSAEEAQLAAERERSNARSALLKQLSTVLETRDTERGLIIELADVHFETAQYGLKGSYREVLAKVAGILLTVPELTIEVEGFTDNVGTESYNQTLSQRRADAVRDYLVQQGVAPSRITARGLGEEHPAASNDSAEGRSMNRRVDLILSGESIGTFAAENIQQIQ